MTLAAARRSALFNAPLDSAAQTVTLARELHIASGFTLIFAVCNRWEEAKRQSESLQQKCSDLLIQEIALLESTPHLLDFLRTHLETPLPDAVFVYGLENWIPDTAAPKSVPFLLNLNASRNHFSVDCPCPLVFWVPEYLFGLLLRDAPDFVSVRSGFYYFAASPLAGSELHQMGERLGQSRAINLTGPEKEERLSTLSDLLTQIRALPKERRDTSAEIRILDWLADVYDSQGRWSEAVEMYQQSLSIRREFQDRVGEGQTLNNLALLKESQEDYTEALDLVRQAVQVLETTEDEELKMRASNLLVRLEIRMG